jgi:uncharacterized hydrophobic protein (TIGR00271 family)
MSAFGSLLHGSRVEQADYDLLAGKLYFHGSDSKDAYVRFGVQLVLSAVIATGGVIGDSTATVIGAMIIAPLMTPIMATAFAVVAGDAQGLVRSLALVVGGAAVVIAIGWLLGHLIVPEVLDASVNTQVASRIQPRLVDLIVALATGAVGAFALSRENVSDTLPGVAIAISLVPPLSVVGLTLAAGDTADAGGALLLFVTNVTAILVAGGLMLALMGYGRVAWAGASRGARRVAMTCIGVGAVLIVSPLAGTSYRIAQDNLLTGEATEDANEWIAGTDYELSEVKVDGDAVEILIAGDGEPPDVDALVEEIRTARAGADVTVRIVPETILRAEPGER